MSGCRSQILGIKRSEVNIEKQNLLLLLLKRSSHIRNVQLFRRLCLLEIQVDKCVFFEDDYLFGSGLFSRVTG